MLRICCFSNFVNNLNELTQDMVLGKNGWEYCCALCSKLELSSSEDLIGYIEN